MLPGYGVANVSVRRSPEAMRTAILNFEGAVGGLPQTTLPIRHFYIEGPRASHVYAREMTIPAGVALVGRVHKHETLTILSKGVLWIASEAGVKELRAPATWVTPPGTKRAGYALEEAILTTVHLTDELDENKIEADLGTVTYEEYEDFVRELGHAAPPAIGS